MLRRRYIGHHRPETAPHYAHQWRRSEIVRRISGAWVDGNGSLHLPKMGLEIRPGTGLWR